MPCSFDRCGAAGVDSSGTTDNAVGARTEGTPKGG
jgi:hypothetical protein